MNREELIALANKIALCAPVTPEGRAAILLNKSDWTLIENLLRTQASGASTTEAKPMTESEGKLVQCLIDCAQLMDSKRQEGCAWSEWDQNVRASISERLNELYRTPAQPESGGVMYTEAQVHEAVRKTISAMMEEGKICAPSPASEAGREPVVSVKPMELTGGRTDYFVSIRVGDREVTPHVFREEYKAAYHVALYDWLLNGGDKPDLVAFGPNDWPARASPPHPANQVDQERGEKEKNHG